MTTSGQSSGKGYGQSRGGLHVKNEMGWRIGPSLPESNERRMNK